MSRRKRSSWGLGNSQGRRLRRSSEARDYRKPDVAPIEREPAKLSRRIELAQRSYTEVLDATKHQDDKVGRFLTAIAFLTTGAIALIAQDDALRETFEVAEGRTYPLLAWSTGAYFVLTISAVALLLLCLSVPVRLPQTREDPMHKSRLFYSYIATKPIRAWRNEWSRCAECLEYDIADDYINEAHNLAERTNAKYRHSHEASWLFVLALLFLGVSVYLKILVYLKPTGDPNVAFGLGHMIGLAVISATHALLQIYTRSVHDIRSVQKLRDAEKSLTQTTSERVKENKHSFVQRRWTPVLMLGVISFLALVMLTPLAPDEPCYLVLSSVGSVLVGIGWPLWMVRDRWDDQSKAPVKAGRHRDWVLFVVVIGAATAGLVVSAELGQPWQAVALLLPAVAMSTVNGSRPGYSQWRTRRVQRTNPKVDDNPIEPPEAKSDCPICGHPTYRLLRPWL